MSGFFYVFVFVVTAVVMVFTYLCRHDKLDLASQITACGSVAQFSCQVFVVIKFTIAKYLRLLCQSLPQCRDRLQ
jgi:hypothetical protein